MPWAGLWIPVYTINALFFDHESRLHCFFSDEKTPEPGEGAAAGCEGGEFAEVGEGGAEAGDEGAGAGV
jgi:hypothetical protein